MTYRIFRFGDFRLDPARRELWREDDRLQLPPKVFDCIAYLIEHRDRAVGRDELIAAVWGKVDVTDNLLDQIMLRARRALGDTGEERRYILTKPRFGFSWVAATAIEDEPEPAQNVIAAEPAPEQEDIAAPEIKSAVVEAAPASSAPVEAARRQARPMLLAALIVLLIVAIGAVWLSRGTRVGPLHASSEALVLPVVVKADGPFAWVRLGVMDLVADRLREAGLAVVPSDNVVALARGLDAGKSSQVDVDALARTAGAGLLIEAQAEFSGGRWSVSLRTVRGREPAIAVDAQAHDVLEAARSASDRMARELGLLPPDADAVPGDPALALLLRQIDAALLADQTDVARRLLDGLDPAQRALPDVRYRSAKIEFRAGHLELAQAGFESLRDSVSAADDPLLRARVLNGLGNVLFRGDDLVGAERLADEVIDLLGHRPASAELGRALTGRAIARSTQGRFDEAMEDFVRARIVLESIGDRLGLARVEANIGILDARRDRVAEAVPVLAAAADRLAAFQDLTDELFARVALARLRLLLLDPGMALAGDERLRELIEREPNPERRRYANLGRVAVLSANGRIEQAAALLAKVRDEAARDNDKVLLGVAQALAAEQAFVAGDAAHAQSEAQAALSAPWEAEGPRDYARTFLILLRAQLAAGAREAAAATVVAVDDWTARDDMPVGRIYADLVHAEQAGGAGQPELARAAFERALVAAEAGRVPEDLLQVSAAYAVWLLDERDLPRAGVVAGRVAGAADRDYRAALLQLRLYHALGNVDAWRNAVSRARALAGERDVPAKLLSVPAARQ
jgi:DNA-binding winged helix-turn-helix (wHTH) protein/tetratricopeptide (TPR) repeat protein